MEKPRLELPQRVAVSRPVFDRRSTVFFVAGVAGFAVLLWAALRAGGAGGGGNPAAGPLTAAQLEQIALRLEDKNLSAAAAEAWGEYLSVAGLPEPRAAAIHARMGRLLQQAGAYEAAIAQFFRAETLAGKDRGVIGDDVPMRVRDCYQSLGRYAELAREVEERTSIRTEPGDLAGRQIVAEVAGEKITAADFDRMLHEEVERMIEASGGVDARQAEAMRRQMHQRTSRPEARAQMLQQMVARQVLTREARKEKIDQEEGYKRRLVASADMLLASELTARVVRERAGVTPQDVERFYEANRPRYTTPAGGRLARIVCTAREDARKVVELLHGGADFATLARERSVDESTRDEGGELREPIGAEGDVVPGVGADAALRARLWALEAGEFTRDPVQVGEAWHVYRMVEKKPPRTPPLEEIRERVEAECAAARRDEVLQQYIGELFERYQVRLHPAAATTRPAAGDAGPG